MLHVEINQALQYISLFKERCTINKYFEDGAVKYEYSACHPGSESLHEATYQFLISCPLNTLEHKRQLLLSCNENIVPKLR